MTMTTANGVIEQQNAESHDAEKNIFAEPRSDGNRRADDGNRRADDGERRSNNDPRKTSSRARTTSRGATSATFMAGWCSTSRSA